MNKHKKKNCPSAGTPRQSEKSKTRDNEQSSSQSDSSTKPAPRPEGRIEKLLPHGAENAISTEQLLHLTGIRHSRALQDIIAAEREHGALILSASKGGYFKPDDGDKGQQEIADFIHTLHARAISTLKALSAARKALGVIDGQDEMEGW